MSYYNTNEESGSTLQASEEQAQSQEFLIARFMHDRKDRNFTAHEIRNYFPRWPITSIRRAMTNLMNKGQLVKTDEQRVGEYKKKTFAYQYAEPKPEPKQYKQGNLFTLW